MRSSFDQGETLSTTTKEENKSAIQLKEKSYLFNCIDKLAADHNVTVSNTMIKVTYKKALKDHYDNGIDGNKESIYLENNMNVSEIKRNKIGESVNLCNSDILLVPNRVKSQYITKAASGLHSTPKQQLVKAKKREYINGLDVTMKQSNCKSISVVNLSQVQNMSKSKQSNSSTSPKVISRKKSAGTCKSNDMRLLKDINLVKVKESIISKSSGGVSRPRKSQVDVKKLENGVKSKVEGSVRRHTRMDILKRKSSNSNVNVIARKIKSDKSKEVENSCKKVEESNKSGENKKAIMLVDPELPSGWTRFIRTKNKGSANEQHVVYVVSPQGKKFRFKWKLRKFLERTNSSLDADQFFFGLYKRPKSSHLPGPERNDNRNSLKSSKSSALQVRATPVHKDPSRESVKISDQSSPTGEASKSPGKAFGADGRELLLFDPDLPFGWKRIIHSNSSNGRLQVHIISPEGRIFRRRYRLNEYLTKHQYTHNLDRFYFGLYPKKEGNGCGSGSENSAREAEDAKTLSKPSDGNDEFDEDEDEDEDSSNCEGEDGDEGSEILASETDLPNSPMYSDPNLPEGWKRLIKTRGCGESAGRMEVVIVSPDGKRHRSRTQLEQYLQQRNLDHNPKDFDFTLLGKPNVGRKRSLPPEPKEATPGTKKKFSDKPVPSLDLDSLKDVNVTPEGQMIDAVAGLMMSCGLSSARSERRLRVPRREHEKSLGNYLNSESVASSESSQVPTHWIQRLVKCRSDFRVLEPDAVFTIAEKTKEFIEELSRKALSASGSQGSSLRYEDVAEAVNRSECLSPLQALIPQKVSYREFIRLNRPKQFLSFT